MPVARVLLGPWEFSAGILGILCFIGAYAIPTPYIDYFLHLAVGRYVVEHRALPVPDVFSFTAVGRTWVAHEWLAGVIQYALYRWFGVGATLALYGLCTAGVAPLVLIILRRCGVRLPVATAWTVLMFLAMLSLVGPYPQVMGFLLLAAVLWVLERWIHHPDRGIWVVPVLIYLWANLHGSYAIGLGVLLLLLLGDLAADWMGWDGAQRLQRRERGRLALVLGVSLLLLLANANGPELLLFPLTHLHSNPLDRFIGGSPPTDVTNPQTWPFFLLIGGYAALVALRRPHLALSDLFLVACFGFGALWTYRFVPFSAIVLAVLVGHVLAQPSQSELPQPRWRVRLPYRRKAREMASASPSGRKQVLNAVVLLVAIVEVLVLTKHYDPARTAQEPVAAVDALGSDGLQGPLFNDYNWGTYLTWKLWPRTRVFIDSRGIDLFSDGGELRQYLDVIYLRSGGDAVLDRYGIRTVLFERDTPLVRYLLAGGKWQTTYDDGRVVRLERRP